jgi:hypothetical protein
MKKHSKPVSSSRHVCNTINKAPSQPGLAKSATKVNIHKVPSQHGLVKSATMTDTSTEKDNQPVSPNSHACTKFNKAHSLMANKEMHSQPVPSSSKFNTTTFMMSKMLNDSQTVPLSCKANSRVTSPTPRPTPPPESSPSQSCKPPGKFFSVWRQSWQWGLNQASAVCRGSGELNELLDIFFHITTVSEYLSVNPKHLSDTNIQIQDKFGMVTIKTLNRHYRRLMKGLFKQKEAGEKGEQLIKGFSEEFIG